MQDRMDALGMSGLALGLQKMVIWNVYHMQDRMGVLGQLECLTYAHENGCFWDESTCMEAAVNGRLECLAYAH